MFAWTAEEYQEMISALEQVHELRPSFRALFKVPDQGENDKLPPASALPSFIRREVWLPSVDAVYNHPATKVIVHHGGGNTFNEAVYHGIPQLVCPQWSDTYDYAAIAKGFGLVSPQSRIEIALKAPALTWILFKGPSTRQQSLYTCR